MYYDILDITPIGVVYLPAYSKNLYFNKEKDCDYFIITFFVRVYDGIGKGIVKKIENKVVELKDCNHSFMNIVKNEKIDNFGGYSINPNDIKITYEIDEIREFVDGDFKVVIDKNIQEEYLINRLMGN